MGERQSRGLLTLALFAVTLLVMLTSGGNVYACALLSFTVTVTPPSVAQGATFQVSGCGFNTAFTWNVEIWADSSGSCAGPPITALTQAAVLDSFGNVAAVTVSSSSLGVGTHCIEIVSPSILSHGTGSVIVTAAPIPEYPYGLVILAVLMVFSYGVIKRRTAIKKLK